MRDIPEGAFGRVFLPEFLGYSGFPATGMGYAGYALAVADGDYEAVLKLARASAKRLEDVKNSTPTFAQSGWNAALEIAYRTAADASYRLKRYAAAEGDIRRALELRKSIPTRMLSETRDAAAQTTLAAMIAARLGHTEEAAQLVGPVLELHRGLYARTDNEDLTQRVEFAQALYASALAGSRDRRAELKQAAALIDALPGAMRVISVARLRASIAEAQQGS